MSTALFLSPKCSVIFALALQVLNKNSGGFNLLFYDKALFRFTLFTYSNYIDGHV